MQTPLPRNSLITKTQWILIRDKEQYIKFLAMTVISHILMKQIAGFSIRKKEHLADIRHLRFDKSALTKHVFVNEHSMDWINS